MTEQYHEFTTKDGQQWRIRQASKAENADAMSAYRVMYFSVLNNKRLAKAGAQVELEAEARRRAIAAEAVFMLPLLLERPSSNDEGWRLAYPVDDEDAMAELEALPASLLAEFVTAYFSPADEPEPEEGE